MLSCPLPAAGSRQAALLAPAVYNVVIQNPSGGQSKPLTVTVNQDANASDDAGGGVSFQQVYAYPNPSVRVTQSTFHVELAGSIDELKIRVFDTAGDMVSQNSLYPSGAVVGASGVPTYEWPWSHPQVASGLYLYVVEAKSGGGVVATTSGKLAIVR
jgi:hypothetical protein